MLILYFQVSSSKPNNEHGTNGIKKNSLTLIEVKILIFVYPLSYFQIFSYLYLVFFNISRLFFSLFNSCCQKSHILVTEGLNMFCSIKLSFFITLVFSYLYRSHSNSRSHFWPFPFLTVPVPVPDRSRSCSWPFLFPKTGTVKNRNGKAGNCQKREQEREREQEQEREQEREREQDRSESVTKTVRNENGNGNGNANGIRTKELQ